LREGIPFKNDFRPSEAAWNPCKSKLWASAVVYSKLISGSNISGKELSELLQKIKATGNIKRGMKQGAVTMVDRSASYNLFNVSDIEGIDPSFGVKKKDYNDVFGAQKVAAAKLVESLWERPQQIVEGPKVTVGTVHSVKGGEADNVWIEGKVGRHLVRRIAESGRTATNDEFRIAYVAATRAKKRLGIVSLERAKGIPSPFLPI
jgi:superfamily I DNA/RNA helicase